MDAWKEQAGLIPAHAGKTPRPADSFPRLGAHPRSRGENGWVDLERIADSGSSPLTRGKRRRLRVGIERLGLIPAHAGKTGLRPIPVRAEWAHPRSRGENDKQRRAEEQIAGSSPLTRGKQRPRGKARTPSRLIPAHAGKTRRRSRTRRSAWAHPRSRGENGSTTALGVTPEGSSPLTRGKLFGHFHDEEAAGLIPAHAGKTLPDLRFYRADRSDLGKP